MAATAGYNTLVKIGLITDVTTRTDYALSEVSGSGGLIWAGGSERYIWDPSTTLIVKINSTPTASGWTFDYLLGILTFDSDQSGNTIEVTGDSFDVFTVAQAHACSLTISAAMLEDTVYQDTAISRIYGLFDVSGTLSRFELGNADYDPGAGTVSMYDIMTNRRTVILEVRPVASLDAVFRITALLESEEASTEVAGILDSVATFQGTLLTGASSSVAYGDPQP